MRQNARTLTKNVEKRHAGMCPVTRRTAGRTIVRILRRTLGRLVGPLAAVAFTALLTLSSPAAHAQQSNASETVKAQRLLDIADSPLPSTEPARLPSHGSGSGNPGDIDYELRERPTAPAQVNLSTTVETTVENRTTNAVGGGGRGPAEAPRPPSPQKDAAPAAALEFRALVAQTVGQDLPIFGESLFGADSALKDVDPLTVPADYRIGPGDQLLIRAWGQISIDFQGAVSRSGTVFLTGIGEVSVAGLRLDEARDLIRGVVSTQYRDFQLTVSLAQLRDIRVYLSGFVAAPGVHTLPSTSTALSGLLAAGGPAPSADLRAIEVRRDGRTVAVLDSYRFLLRGDKSGDPQLLPGDVLYLPPARGFAAIAGSVRRPAIYHLAAATTLAELLDDAGGTTVTADLLQARIERFVAGRRTVVDVDGDPRRSAMPVRDGDIVLLVPASPRFEASITVSGHVAVPLRQPWRPGMTVSDALPNADALMPYAAWSERNARNPLSGVAGNRDASAMPPRLSEVDWDHAAIERIDPATQRLSRIEFDLGAALATPHGDADPPLQAGDTILIYGEDEFVQPERKRLRMVRVEGEVAVPGVYSMAVGESLRDAIARAGGPTPEAYLYGTVLSRASARAQEAERLKQVVDQAEQDYDRFLATRSRDIVSQEDALVSGSETGNARALIARLRAVQPIGRVVFSLDGEIDDAAGLPAMPLEDGDVVAIPRRTETVTIAGAVFQQGTQLWKEGASAADYLRDAGGTRPYADRAQIVVFHADGTVRPLHRGPGGTTIHPGDSILVPENVDRTTLGRRLREWTTILYQMALGAAALKVIRN